MFDKALLHGVEFTLFLLDLAILCAFDALFGASSVALSAFLTYAVTIIYTMLRLEFGKRNIARKTLIDANFLI